VDTYALGVIFWEITSREHAWEDYVDQALVQDEYYKTTGQAKSQDERHELVLSLVAKMVKRDGARPQIANNNEKFQLLCGNLAATVASLISSCWATDPANRPSFDAIIVSTTLTHCASG
jgi:hypothetical protein